MTKPYVPVAPLDEPPQPLPANLSPVRREAELRRCLRGVALGAHDERLIAWTVRTLDDPTVQTLLSWVERARLAEITNRQEA